MPFDQVPSNRDLYLSWYENGLISLETVKHLMDVKGEEGLPVEEIAEAVTGLSAIQKETSQCPNDD